MSAPAPLPTFLAWAPRSVRDDDVLAAIAKVLTELETVDAVDALEHDPRADVRRVLDRLRPCGIARFWHEPDRFDPYRLAGLNALLASVSGSLAITAGVQALALLPVVRWTRRRPRRENRSSRWRTRSAARLAPSMHGAPIAGGW